jgi:hypothetical protein
MGQRPDETVWKRFAGAPDAPDTQGLADALSPKPLIVGQDAQAHPRCAGAPEPFQRLRAGHIRIPGQQRIVQVDDQRLDFPAS